MKYNDKNTLSMFEMDRNYLFFYKIEIKKELLLGKSSKFNPKIFNP